MMHKSREEIWDVEGKIIRGRKERIFTKDNPKKQMRNWLGSLLSQLLSCNNHRFKVDSHHLVSFPFYSVSRPRDYTTQKATLRERALPSATGSQPTIPKMQRDALMGCAWWLEARRALLAHLGAPGALQHLLSERDHISTAGVHFLREESLHGLAESRLRIWRPCRHRLS